MLDTVIRHRLSVYYMANGQRVPEDLHVANADYLVRRAFRPARSTSPYVLQDDDVPAVLSGARQAIEDLEARMSYV